MAQKDIEGLLRDVPLFEGFSKRELRRLMESMRESWFNAGEDIVTAGEAGARFYVIVEGRAKVLVGDEERKNLGPGQAFGEMALIDRAERSATIRAETKVQAVWLSSTEFLAVLEENWDMAKKVMSELVKRIRRLEEGASV